MEKYIKDYFGKDIICASEGKSATQKEKPTKLFAKNTLFYCQPDTPRY